MTKKKVQSTTIAKQQPSPSAVSMVQAFYKLPTLSGEEDCSHVDSFIREAKLALHLQPLDEKAGALWLLAALTGRARQLVLSLPVTEVDSPTKILEILADNWGEQRDVTTLCAALFNRRQGPDENIVDYACHLRNTWSHIKARNGVLPANTLRDVFARGLEPAELGRDVRRYVRDHPGCTLDDAVTEARLWLRDRADDPPATNATVDSLNARLAVLTAEIASLRQLELSTPALSQQATGPTPHLQSCTPDQWGPDPLSCTWCGRKAHSEQQCRHKQRYMKQSSQEDPDCIIATLSTQSSASPSRREAPCDVRAPTRHPRRRRRRQHRQKTSNDQTTPVPASTSAAHTPVFTPTYAHTSQSTHADTHVHKSRQSDTHTRQSSPCDAHTQTITQSVAHTAKHTQTSTTKPVTYTSRHTQTPNEQHHTLQSSKQCQKSSSHDTDDSGVGLVLQPQQSTSKFPWCSTSKHHRLQSTGYDSDSDPVNCPVFGRLPTAGLALAHHPGPTTTLAPKHDVRPTPTQRRFYYTAL